MKGLCNYCLESDKELELHTGTVICNDCWVKELVKLNPIRVKIEYFTGGSPTDTTECIDTKVGKKECYGCNRIKIVYYNPDSDGTLMCLMCLKDQCDGFNFRPIDKNEKTIAVDLKKLNAISSTTMYDVDNGKLVHKDFKTKPDQVAIPESQWIRARDYQ